MRTSSNRMVMVIAICVVATAFGSASGQALDPKVDETSPDRAIADLKSQVKARDIHIQLLNEEIRRLGKEVEELRIQKEAYRLAMEKLAERPIVVQVNADGKPVEAGKAANADADADGQAPDDKQADAEGDPTAPKSPPRFSHQISLGLLSRTGEIRTVRRADDGFVYIRDSREVDRDHVIIRGNFKNESADPYRYTFEIRIGGKPNVTHGPEIIGSWRYQTPELSSGEIHQFEIKVPVTHVSQVRSYALGNVVADTPGEEDPLFKEEPNDGEEANGVDGEQQGN